MIVAASRCSSRCRGRSTVSGCGPGSFSEQLVAKAKSSSEDRVNPTLVYVVLRMMHLPLKIDRKYP